MKKRHRGKTAIKRRKLGVRAEDIGRNSGVSVSVLYNWHSKYAGREITSGVRNREQQAQKSFGNTTSKIWLFDALLALMITALDHRLSERDSQIVAFLSSASWRITRPLRRLKTIFSENKLPKKLLSLI